MQKDSQSMRMFCNLLSCLAILLWCQATLAEFSGWQEHYVIHQDGHPRILRAADLNGDGRQELVVVNSRFSRLDIYQWLPPESRSEPESPEPDHPNDFPMAPEFRHLELQLERPPQDVVVEDLTGDGKSELIVLASPPNQIVVYSQVADGEWELQYQLDLLGGEITSGRSALLIRQADHDKRELLVSCSSGIQQLTLAPGGRARWLMPHEQRDRTNWWLADLDGDGREDLIEQTRDATEAIRWHRCSKHGSLMPAQRLFDRAVNDAEVLRNDESVQLVLLDGAVQELLRRYELDFGQPSPFGERQPLALVGGDKAVWCGLWQGSDRALVVADPDSPRLITYVLSEDGWDVQDTFPAVSDVEALATPAAKPGTLLIWAKNAADLRISRFESQRLTYPEPWQQSPDTEDRKILALQTVGSTVWWLQRVGKHLDLYRWLPEQPEPSRVRFDNVGAQADRVLWIGGERLLVNDTHARGLKLVVNVDGTTVVSSPTHLRRADLSDFRLVAVDDEFRLARRTNGVLQWIGEDLQPYEQIMLPEGQELSDYVADSKFSGWALQKGSPFIHQIEIDSSGLSRAVKRIKVSEGVALVRDPVLGFVLVDRDRVTRLSEGRPLELKLVDMVDERVGRAEGIRKTNLNRLGTTDVDGDGHDELILYDDLKHRLTVVADVDGKLQPRISWPVFDDKTYPYDDDSGSLVHEPRAVLGVDLEGDNFQDLALLCHDRLLIYLARKQP